MTITKTFKDRLKNARGISLVEVVASVIIIGIILISFFGLLVQANKSTKSSNNIMDATYAAQQEMERIYISSTISQDARKVVTNINHTYVEEIDPNFISNSSEYIELNGSKHFFEEKLIYKRSDDNFNYTITVRSFGNSTLYKDSFSVIVFVENKVSQGSSTMESIYNLGGV